MSSKADFKKFWKKQDPEHRRHRLNELGAMPQRGEILEREHDALAELVAKDEEDAQDAAKEEAEADDRS